jgi:thioredoxin-related protein
MIKYFSFAFFLVLSGIQSLFSQDKTITISIKELKNQPVILADFYGDRNKNLDTVTSDTNGQVRFIMNRTRLPGLYRISINPNSFADFIYNNESVVIETVSWALMDSIRVIESMENSIYFSFLRDEQKFQQKLDLLKPLVDRYPTNDPFFKSVKKEFRDLQNDREEMITKTIQKYPEMFVSRLLKLQLMPFIDPEKTAGQRLFDMRLTFFDRFEFDDTLLIRTDAYTTKAINYLMLYSDRNFSQEQLEDNFIKAVDIVLGKTRRNQRIYEFILNYYTKGFEKYGFEKVLLHLAEKYVAENKCDDQKPLSDLQKRMENYIKLAVGKTAPDFEVQTLEGKSLKINQINSKYILIIFWSSSCPHCKELLHQLKDYYSAQNEKRFEFLGISLDTDRNSWVNELKNQELPWPQSCDLAGWGGLVPGLYNIYATPTMFLLDKNLKIIAKPITFNQFVEEVKQL